MFEEESLYVFKRGFFNMFQFLTNGHPLVRVLFVSKLAQVLPCIAIRFVQVVLFELLTYHFTLHVKAVLAEGKIVEGRSIDEANEAIEKEMLKLTEEGITTEELEKAKNKIEAMIEFEDMNILSRANNLAFYELLGDANLINTELSKYNAVTSSYLQETAKSILRSNNSSTLLYRKNLS